MIDIHTSSSTSTHNSPHPHITDGDTEEENVKESCIRSQRFNLGDVVEVNCGNKGVWYRSEIIEVFSEKGEYQVKYENDNIKWVGDSVVEGTGKTNR